MSRGIIYLNIGVRCAVRLTCSLWSLRNRYDGPVAVFNAKGYDQGIAAKIGSESRLGIEMHDIDIPMHRRRTAYAAKPSCYKWTPFDRTLFIDADTVIAADPSPLFDVDAPLVVTQFSDWNCGGKMISSRCRKLLGVKCPPLDVDALVHQVIREAWPHVNTGIYAFDRDWDGMPLWEKFTQAARRKANFTDEVCCNCILPAVDHKIVGEEYNASPLYRKCKSEDVVIYHFHGNKQCRPEALPYWWPIFEEVRSLNIADINSWLPAGDRRLAAYLQEEQVNA